MAVREAAEADVPSLLPLLRAYADFYESSPSDGGLEAVARAAIVAPQDQAFLLVATGEGSEVIGFALCQWKWSSLSGARVVVLDDLFVAEPARGGGHADALIASCADLGRLHGAPLLVWQTAPDNHRAQAVYDRLGGRHQTFLEYELEL